ncbi:hypothetical protein LCM20_01400 [Halobacillus litoralis]|uniref:hypothetical protein n=1 Tax=Halobacillus litoralis TaxID=45668 RepID=UPI001CD76E15|nr:hypothetical protein [Halobacillus litoralis]MCA0969241.1 hypothetical protein [Halobacillus litoralis]
MIWPIIGISAAVGVVIYAKVKEANKKHEPPIRQMEVEKTNEEGYERAKAKEYVHGGSHVGGGGGDA